MNNELISVIMSTYNESASEVNQAVESILTQSYKKIELIIICDNPQNIEVIEYLDTINDKRVKVFVNNKNIGLVKSLNRALKYANGDYIARMDADDISMHYRLERQIEFIKKNDLSIVGGALQIIDENGNIMNRKMKFPINDSKIKKCILYGSCIAHPTWLVKKNVYSELGGYREILYCEDYDFLLRAIYVKNYRLGNLNDVVLKYRIREKSISNANSIDQYLIRRYLKRKRKTIYLIDENNVYDYMKSEVYVKEKSKYVKYLQNKKERKFTIVFNAYLYEDILEKIVLKWREL